MQMARKNPVYRDSELECNKKIMKMARKDAAYRDLEKKKKMTRKDATYRDLVKIFKSWQVCDWLAKWIIMLRFMDLRWPRVFRRSNVGLVKLDMLPAVKSIPGQPTPGHDDVVRRLLWLWLKGKPVWNRLHDEYMLATVNRLTLWQCCYWNGYHFGVMLELKCLQWCIYLQNRGYAWT